ncbi:MAG: HlyD family efflux transporter periplasmic adaptor subunit [Methylococcaceae bacterium]
MSALFRQEALDNQRERLWGEVILTQPLSFYLITGAVTVVVIFIAAFLLYGTYARRENVSGYLVPDKGIIKIYATQSGLVTTTHVVEGDHVSKGDLLFSISTQKTNLQAMDVDMLITNKLKENKATITSKLEQQKRLNGREKAQYHDQITGLKQEILQLKALINTHENKYAVSRVHFGRLKQLLAKKFISKADYIVAQEHHVDIQLSLNESRQQLSIKRNQLSETNNQFSQLPLKNSIQLAEFNQQLSDIEQKILETEGRRTYTLRAPISGRVTAIQASHGHAVKAAPLLSILPDGAKFKAELFIPTRAIGFVNPGQSVLLRYSAFPYQRFGLYHGTIDKVTEVILTPEELQVPVKLEEPVYRVSVMPQQQEISAYGRQFDLQAGMLLEASIILEGRSLGEWLLAPIYSLRGRL